jgi:threonylcarbamoyladenosine tRNA methylthiotransferase MtaB
MEPDVIVAHLFSLGAAGYREVVLSGIHLGCYGLDLSPPVSLAGLMDRFSAERPVERLRLSSIEPPELTDEIIQRVAASDGFCRHFHLPLQSGDDDILQRMGRPYDAALFRDRVDRILGRIPEAAVGVDVLVGFPGETDAAFHRTFRLIRDLPVAYLHVFPFSPRPGTPAATFPDPVEPQVIKARCAALREEGNRKKADFFRRQEGEIRRVLVEERRDSATGLLKGMTDTYVPILLEGSDDLKKKLVDVKIEEIIEPYSVRGVIVDRGGAGPAVSEKNT